jgi:hypothetical protein
MTRLRQGSGGQALATRSAASRKAWETRRRMAELRDALAGGPPMPAPEQGSAQLPKIDMSIPAILARLKAAGVGQ